MLVLVVLSIKAAKRKREGRLKPSKKLKTKRNAKSTNDAGQLVFNLFKFVLNHCRKAGSDPFSIFLISYESSHFA